MNANSKSLIAIKNNISHEIATKSNLAFLDNAASNKELKFFVDCRITEDFDFKTFKKLSEVNDFSKVTIVNCSNVFNIEGQKNLFAEAFNNLKHLTYLNLANTCPEDLTFATILSKILVEHTSLTFLDLSSYDTRYSSATKVIIESFKKLINLKSLILKSSNIFFKEKTSWADLCAILLTFEKLEHLDISGNSIYYEDEKLIAQALKNKANLTHLTLNVLHFQEPELIESIKKLNNLAYFSVGDIKSRSSYQNDGIKNVIEAISPLKIKYLNIQSYDLLTAEAISVLSAALTKWDNLIQLSLPNCNIGGNGIVKIINGLRKANVKTLEYIDLSRNDFNHSSNIIFEFLADQQNLGLLDLNDSKLYDLHAFGMERVLKDKTKLKYINLGKNIFEHEAIGDITRAISNLQNLEYLNLNCFNGYLFKEQIDIIINSLKNKPKLISLDLSDIPFANSSAQSLGDTLKELKTLQKLKLDKIKINKAGVLTILNSLKDNKIITYLSIQNLPLVYDESINSSEVIKDNHLWQEEEANRVFGPPDKFYYQTFFNKFDIYTDDYDTKYKILFFKDR
jgi:Ran GTPase-activating protein (RanGAP) involved in mRNA processing and transport